MAYSTPELLLVGAAQNLVLNTTIKTAGADNFESNFVLYSNSQNDEMSW